MTLSTKLAAAVVGAVVALAATKASHAHHVPRQPLDEAASVALLRTAESHGVAIFLDTGDESAARICKEEEIFGAANRLGQLLLCVERHNGDGVELADTIRHELVHIAQYCKARRVGATSATLFPSSTEHFISVARDYLHWNPQAYRAAQHSTEAEARVLAHELTEQQIGIILERNCGK